MILIADNSPSMRRAIRTVLEGTADTFIECEDGKEAVELYARHHPSWVLMDVGMQPVDGITATRQLKVSYPAARVIIVTDYNDPQLRADASEAGAYAYILKDDLSELLSIITKEES